MADTVSAKFYLLLQATVGVDLSQDNSTDPDIVEEFGQTQANTLDANTTPAVTKSWSDQVSLTAGTVTLDLTALSRGTNMSTVNMNGLKVQLVKIKAKSTNTQTITIADAASNGYNLFGDASGQVTLDASGEIMQYTPELLANISSTAKDITITSNDVDAIFDIQIVAG